MQYALLYFVTRYLRILVYAINNNFCSKEVHRCSRDIIIKGKIKFKNFFILTVATFAGY